MMRLTENQIDALFRIRLSLWLGASTRYIKGAAGCVDGCPRSGKEEAQGCGDGVAGAVWVLGALRRRCRICTELSVGLTGRVLPGRSLRRR